MVLVCPREDDEHRTTGPGQYLPHPTRILQTDMNVALLGVVLHMFAARLDDNDVCVGACVRVRVCVSRSSRLCCNKNTSFW